MPWVFEGMKKTGIWFNLSIPGGLTECLNQLPCQVCRDLKAKKL